MTLATVDLSPRIGTQVQCNLEQLLDGSVARELRTILEARGVLLIRGVDMSEEQQLQFGKTLGTPRNEHGVDVTTVSADATINPIFAEYTEGTYFFHFDDVYMDTPALASILRAKVIAPKGGQTEFANTYAIYEDLAKDEQDFLDTLEVVHSQETIQRKAFPNPTEAQIALWGEGAIPPKSHPLVWIHRTGRKSLLISNTMREIVGMDRAESDALIKRLMGLAEKPEYIYTHDWQVGDIIIWDNTGTMHRVVPFDLSCGRKAERVKLAGEERIRSVQMAAEHA